MYLCMKMNNCVIFVIKINCLNYESFISYVFVGHTCPKQFFQSLYLKIGPSSSNTVAVVCAKICFYNVDFANSYFIYANLDGVYII